jgi:general secretion pathway protein G
MWSGRVRPPRLFLAPDCACLGSRKRSAARQSGLTLIELIVATAILLILTTAALPLARVQLRRDQERELRLALREIRTAIDRYKDASDIGRIQVELGTEGYPKDLESMVEGVTIVNSPTEMKLRVLRRIPKDPMTNSTDWGLRSYQDEPDSTSWGGENVFDVYTRSEGIALDGTNYKDW